MSLELNSLEKLTKFLGRKSYQVQVYVRKFQYIWLTQSLTKGSKELKESIVACFNGSTVAMEDLLKIHT